MHTKAAIYIFEFKLWSTGTSQEALEQIRTKGYEQPYLSSGKKLILIGASFDEEKRNIGAWEVEEVDIEHEVHIS